MPYEISTFHQLKNRILVFGRMIKISHTVFALPFALSAVVLAHRETPVTVSGVFWILVAMVGARSAAMGFNRITDARLDANNPRTADREIPKGKISTAAAVVFVLLFSALFVTASAFLSRLCFHLSFPVLAVLLFYSYAKRFTWLCHLYLGFAISLAPLGAWIAVTGGFDARILLLSFGLMTYIAGFDILYACQDIQFDRQSGLFSIPAHFGVKTSLLAAKLIHAGSLLFFLLLIPAFHLGGIYLLSVAIIAMLFYIEHRLVNPDDLSRINIAFFHMNSIISVALFIGISADLLFR